jgi:hypothetical protein
VFSRNEYRTLDLSAYDPREAEEFRTRFLPVGETRAGPVVEWHGYAADFLRILDFETLGLQEDYQLGHEP